MASGFQGWAVTSVPKQFISSPRGFQGWSLDVVSKTFIASASGFKGWSVGTVVPKARAVILKRRKTAAFTPVTYNIVSKITSEIGVSLTGAVINSVADQGSGGNNYVYETSVSTEKATLVTNAYKTIPAIRNSSSSRVTPVINTLPPSGEFTIYCVYKKLNDTPGFIFRIVNNTNHQISYYDNETFTGRTRDSIYIGASDSNIQGQFSLCNNSRPSVLICTYKSNILTIIKNGVTMYKGTISTPVLGSKIYIGWNLLDPNFPHFDLFEYSVYDKCHQPGNSIYTNLLTKFDWNIQKNISCIGDSISTNDYATVNYIDNIINDIGTTFSTNKAAYAVSGFTAIQQWIPVSNNITPPIGQKNYVFVFCGTNDIWGFGETAQAVWNAVAILCLTAKQRGNYVFCITALPRGNDSTKDPIRLQFNALMRANYKDVAHGIVDCATDIIGVDGSQNSTTYYVSDQTHLNNAGHRRLADMCNTAMIPFS